MPKSIVRTLRIDSSDWAFFQTVLTRGTPNPALDKTIVACYTVDFGKGIYATIEFANYEDAPCIIPILKDKNNSEFMVRLDSRFKLLGTYRFSTVGPDYVINVLKAKNGAMGSKFV